MKKKEAVSLLELEDKLTKLFSEPPKEDEVYPVSKQLIRAWKYNGAGFNLDRILDDKLVTLKTHELVD